MPKSSSKQKRKYNKKGGNPQQPVATPAQQQVAAPAPVPQQPIPVAQQPKVVPGSQLRSFNKKIRLNVTSDIKSVIAAPEDAEYILAERLNSQKKYGMPDIYTAKFGNDQESGTPIDIYTDYVYERLKDLGKKDCQALKHKGDKPIKGFFSSSTRRQECSKSIKSVIKDDNRILQKWSKIIENNGIKFLENVEEKIKKLDEEIKELQDNLKDKQQELKDASATLNENVTGINRETQQRLQEITRVINEKEEKMGRLIDEEIDDLQKYIKDETEVINEIEKIDKAILKIQSDIQGKIKEKTKVQNGLNKVYLNLQQRGIDLNKLFQEVENSVNRYASMTGGARKKRKYKKRTKKNKKSKKKSKKKSNKKGGTKLKRQNRMGIKDIRTATVISTLIKKAKKSEKELVKEAKDYAKKIEKMKLHKKMMGKGKKKSKKSKKSKK